MKGKHATRRNRREEPIRFVPLAPPPDPHPIRMTEHVAAWLVMFGVLAIVSGVAAR